MGKLTEADDPEAARAAAVAKQTSAEQVVRDCEARVAAKTADRDAAVAEAGAFARLSAAGAKHDPDALKAHASPIAIAAAELAIEQETLDEARHLAATAGTEVLKARRQVALRDAQRLLAPVTAARHAVADAGDTLVSAVKKAIAATEEQMSAAAVAEGLRLELLGIPDTRPYRFPHELEVRRFLSCLPTEWLREAGNGGFPVGDVNLRKAAD